jgi:hypothetical protein
VARRIPLVAGKVISPASDRDAVPDDGRCHAVVRHQKE